MRQAASRIWPIAFPYPHFMGFAPLDVWARLLLRSPVSIPPRYWPRLGCALLLSLFTTIVTLPERILAALYLRLRRRREPLPGPIIILGYYRSGTTLLQCLLSCDPNIYWPHWGQAFAPQGGWLTWGLLRWFVLPFFPRTRPQDNVAFGPLVPAEDDFALNAWALASPLPGRFIVPQAFHYFQRFHDLKELTPAEYQRWHRYQEALLHKLAPQAGQRRVLLKTPAHTARIPALLEVCKGTTGAKFLYISRQPEKVLRSNVAMLARLSELCAVGPPLLEEELEEYLLQEYVATEEEYLRTRALIPEGDLVEIRLQDLQADPLGTLRRAYEQLGLPFTPAFEQRALLYLHANQDYKPNTHSAWAPKQPERIKTALQPLIEHGRHNEPAPQRIPLPPLPAGVHRRHLVTGLALGAAAAVGMTAMIVLAASWVGVHCIGLGWPCGVAIGAGALCGAHSQGSTRLGLAAMLLTALALAVGGCLAPDLGEQMRQTLPLSLIFAPLWAGLGLAAAYRIGSQRL